jgi:hypothetical protein
MEKVKAPVYMLCKPQENVPSCDRRMLVSYSSTAREDFSARTSPRGAVSPASMVGRASKDKSKIEKKGVAMVAEIISAAGAR